MAFTDIFETLMTTMTDLLGDDAPKDTKSFAVDGPRSERDRKFEATLAAIDEALAHSPSPALAESRARRVSVDTSNTLGVDKDDISSIPSIQSRTSGPAKAELWRSRSTSTTPQRAAAQTVARHASAAQSVSRQVQTTVDRIDTELDPRTTARREQQRATSPDLPSRHASAVIVSDERPSTSITPQQMRELTIARSLQRQGISAQIVVLEPKSINPQFLQALNETNATLVVRDRNQSPKQLFDQVKAGADHQIVGAFVTEPSGLRETLLANFKGVRIVGDLAPRTAQELKTPSVSPRINASELSLRSGLLAADRDTTKRITQDVARVMSGRSAYPDESLHVIQDAQGNLKIYNVQAGNKIREVTNGFIEDPSKEYVLDKAIGDSLGYEAASREQRQEFVQALEGVGISGAELEAEREAALAQENADFALWDADYELSHDAGVDSVGVDASSTGGFGL